MLVRPEGDGGLLIAQQAHAWVSGQIARAWGNERFDPPEPREQVCLAAEQHDLGMTSFDMAPTLNPETGLPHSFTEMPLARHVAIWRLAPRRMLIQDRYAALLVSMHGVALYERRKPSPAVQAYIREQRAFQQELAGSLVVPAEELARNQKLIWTFDALSLALLLDWDPFTVEGVERRGATLDPWPFRGDALEVRCDARRLQRRFEDEDEMLAALVAAPWETLEVRLTR